MSASAPGPVIGSVDELLTTTRAVRRRLDLTRPVPREVLEQCVAMARQAPIAGNVEQCRFIAVDDPQLRDGIAGIYRRAADEFVYGPRDSRGGAPALSAQMERVMASARALRDHLHEVPVIVLVGSEARPPKAGTGAHASGFYGSVYPQIWSLQLALRSRGLGSSLTCIHLHYAEQMSELLGLPERFTQVALLPVAYTIGKRFKPAKRSLPGDRVLHFNRWESR